MQYLNEDMKAARNCMVDLILIRLSHPKWRDVVLISSPAASSCDLSSKSLQIILISFIMKHVHLQTSTKNSQEGKSVGKAAGFFDTTCCDFAKLHVVLGN